MTKQGSSFSHLHHIQKDLMNTTFSLTQGTWQRGVGENREIKWKNMTVEMALKSAVSCCFLLLLSVYMEQAQRSFVHFNPAFYSTGFE